MSARKDDKGKARFDLIPARSMRKLAELFGMGADKYGDRNWEGGLDWGRIFGAMQRHAWAWWAGEEHDPVDGQHHLTSVAWGAFVLLEYLNTHRELDNRPGLVRTRPETMGLDGYAWSGKGDDETPGTESNPVVMRHAIDEPVTTQWEDYVFPVDGVSSVAPGPESYSKTPWWKEVSRSEWDSNYKELIPKEMLQFIRAKTIAAWMQDLLSAAQRERPVREALVQQYNELAVYLDCKHPGYKWPEELVRRLV